MSPLTNTRQYLATPAGFSSGLLQPNQLLPTPTGLFTQGIPANRLDMEPNVFEQSFSTVRADHTQAQSSLLSEHAPMDQMRGSGDVVKLPSISSLNTPAPLTREAFRTSSGVSLLSPLPLETTSYPLLPRSERPPLHSALSVTMSEPMVYSRPPLSVPPTKSAPLTPGTMPSKLTIPNFSSLKLTTTPGGTIKASFSDSPMPASIVSSAASNGQAQQPFVPASTLSPVGHRMPPPTTTPAITITAVEAGMPSPPSLQSRLTGARPEQRPTATRKRPSQLGNDTQLKRRASHQGSSDSGQSDDASLSSPNRHRDGQDQNTDEKRRQFLERNRKAAHKCRQRRKQWISSLQSQNEYFQQENERLTNEITSLREEVVNLKTLLLRGKDCTIAQANGVHGLDSSSSMRLGTMITPLSNIPGTLATTQPVMYATPQPFSLQTNGMSSGVPMNGGNMILRQTTETQYPFQVR